MQNNAWTAMLEVLGHDDTLSAQYADASKVEGGQLSISSDSLK